MPGLAASSESARHRAPSARRECPDTGRSPASHKVCGTSRRKRASGSAWSALVSRAHCPDSGTGATQGGDLFKTGRPLPHAVRRVPRSPAALSTSGPWRWRSRRLSPREAWPSEAAIVHGVADEPLRADAAPAEARGGRASTPEPAHRTAWGTAALSRRGLGWRAFRGEDRRRAQPPSWST